LGRAEVVTAQSAIAPFGSTAKARPNMNADNIIATDAHLDALRPSTAFTRWGIACPADRVRDLAAVCEPWV
jgi:hypothetical protein